MFINTGDSVKHSILGTGVIEKIDKKMLYVKFESVEHRFMIGDFSRFFKKYFKEENVYKEYDSFTHTWFKENGYDDDGFNRAGYNREGFDREGFNKEGIHFKTKNRYNLDGFDVNGYNHDGFDNKGVHYIKKNPEKLYEMVIDKIKGSINKDSFRNALIEVGRETRDQTIKEELRELYKRLMINPNNWEESVKKKIVSIKGWEMFSSYERTDRPPPKIPNKIRSVSCYKCSESLYTEIHQKCPKCNWLVCPNDNSCGCGFGYKYARNDFIK